MGRIIHYTLIALTTLVIAPLGFAEQPDAVPASESKPVSPKPESKGSSWDSIEFPLSFQSGQDVRKPLITLTSDRNPRRKPGSPTSQTRSAANTDSPATPLHEERSSTPNRLLGPKDLIEIKVFQEKDLDTTTRVSDAGKINFPLIGDVVVEGKTEQKAAQLIRDRLETRFLVDPQVSVTLLEPAKRLFTVLGQVQRPGTYRFPDREVFNLIQVIGIAGGYTRLAAPGRITVKRNDHGKEVVYRLNAKRMAENQTTETFEVAPGDLITVGERLF